MAEPLLVESLPGATIHCQAALPPPPCPQFPAFPAFPACPACPAPVCHCSCPAIPAASSMSSLVGLATLWGACVTFIGPSLFTTEGRAFWGGLWSLLYVYIPVCLGLVWDGFMACVIALSDCLSWCCCCRRKRGNDDKKDGKNGRKVLDLKMGNTHEPNQGSRPETDDTAPRKDALLSLRTQAKLSQAPSGSQSDVPVRSAASTSVSSSVPTTGYGLPAQSRRHPNPPRTAQPLGTNLGQAFDRPGKALAHWKGKEKEKDKNKDKTTRTVALAVQELKLQ